MTERESSPLLCPAEREALLYKESGGELLRRVTLRESKETKEQNSAKLAIKKLRIVVPPSVALGGRASSSSWMREEQVEGGREEEGERKRGLSRLALLTFEEKALEEWR